MRRLTFFLALAILLPSFALAAPTGPGDVADERLRLQNTLTEGPNSVLPIINLLISWIYTIFLVIAVLMILITAYKYLTAGGDEEAVSAAHSSLKWTIVAIAVALLSAGVVTLVESLVLAENPPAFQAPENGSLDIWNSEGGAA